MVKNTLGGSGHKKFARKNTSVGVKSNRLRISEDLGEIYTIVTKVLGNSMFHCYCIDGATRLGHIRGKFSGKGKRDNMIEVGKWVLIGLREWDVSSNTTPSQISKITGKIQQCDLLEVYNDTDKQRLREMVSANWDILDSNDVSKDKLNESRVEGDFIFATDKDIERDKLIEEMNSTTAEKITMRMEGNSVTEEEEINFDDI